MKVGRTILLTAMTGFAGLLGLCDVARAQAPVGPLSPPPPGTMPAAKPREAVPLPAPRQSIVGAWKLNRDESDDMRKRAEDSRGSGGGRRGGGGWPGGGGYGGQGGGTGGEDSEQATAGIAAASEPADYQGV